MATISPQPRLLSLDGGPTDLRGRLRVEDSTSGVCWQLRGEMLLQAITGDGDGATLVLRYDHALASEEYRIDVSDLTIRLSGGSDAGVLYGLQTLVKLVRTHDVAAFPCGRVADAPAQEVRGVSLDIGRRRWAMQTLFEVIDEAAWRGLNRLHLHLTEWNRFNVRLVDPRFHSLAPADAFTSAEVVALVEFARARCMHVAVELNVPAHATAIISAHPALRFGGADAFLNNGENWVGWQTDSWMIDITRPGNRAFIHELFAVWRSEIPADSYHLGGDEWFDPEELDRSPALTAAAALLAPDATAVDVVIDFMNSVARPFIDEGLAVEIWSWPGFFSGADRVVRLDPSFTVLAWDENSTDLAVMADGGHRVILANEKTHYVTPRTPPGNLSGVNYVAFDPHVAALTSAAADHTAGSQLCVWADWAETASDDYFLAYLSRPLGLFAAAVWSPRTENVDDVASAIDQSRRDDAWSSTQRRRGVDVSLEAGSDVRAVRIRPRLPDGVAHADGQFAPLTEQALDNWRGARVQARSRTTDWETLLELDTQLSPTWNWFDLPPRTGAQLRLASRSDSLPDGHVEWLVTTDKDTTDDL